MDIQTWLDETVLPEQHPSPLHQPGTIPNLPHNGPELVPPGKRRAKPTASDSSLLHVPPQPRKAAAVSPPGALTDSAGGSHCRAASSHSNGTASSTSSHPYARKPRRKTRLERYQPALKHVEERGSYARRHRNRESNKSKRRHRRRKADKAGNDIVQGFHAKNVPKDRLTLKPRGKLGLFSKGRASSPVKGRGLPDLVFSEMKFLQSQRDQRDQLEAELEADQRTKRRKRDRAHAKEEAISAYFTSVRPTLAKKDVNIQAKAASQRLQDSNRQGEEHSSVFDSALPTVEPTGQTPFLSFGGRGPRHETESYISCSESIRAPSSAPVHPRITSTVRNGQLDSMSNGHTRGNFDSGAASFSRPASPSMVQCTSQCSAGQFQDSLFVPADHRASQSCSLPQCSSSSRQSNLIEQDAEHRARHKDASPSSVPLLVRHDAERQVVPSRPSTNVASARWKGDTLCHDAHDSPIDASPRHELVPTSGHGADPRTSSTLGRMLENCDAALHDQRQASRVTAVTPAAASPQKTFGKGLPAHTAPFTILQKIPTVRFSGVDMVYHAAVPSYNSIGIYENQEEQEALSQRQTGDQSFLIQEQPVSPDNYSENGEGCALCEMQRSNDETIEAEFDHISEANLTDQRRPNQYQAIYSPMSKGFVKPGFWRPHKLY